MKYDVKPDNKGSDTNSLNGNTMSGSTTRHYTIHVLIPVATDEAINIRAECQALGLLPRVGEPLAASVLYQCENVTVTRKSINYYTAKADYKFSLQPINDTNELPPWQRPALIKFSSVSEEVPTDIDADGNAIINIGTNEPVEGVTRTSVDLLAVITKHFRPFDPAAIKTFAGAVNTDTFLGQPPGTVKVVSEITADPSEYNGLTYYTVVFPAQIREPFATSADKAWYHRRVHKGFYELKNGEVIRARDGLQQYVTTPVLLDANGARLPDGDPPHIIETKNFIERNLSSSGILA